MKNMKLNGLIHSHFASEAELAREMQWSRQRLNRITTGAKEPDLYEVAAIARKLGMETGELVQIFLDKNHQTGNATA